MNPVIIAALLLLQTYSAEDYRAVIQHPIQAVYEPTVQNGGWVFCGDRTIYVNLSIDPAPVRVAGTLAHEVSHLGDYPSGCGKPREAKAMLRTLRVYQRADAPPWRQEWAKSWYWDYWWIEHPSRRSLGIIPWERQEWRKP